MIWLFLWNFQIVLLVLCLCFTLFFMSLVSLVLPGKSRSLTVQVTLVKYLSTCCTVYILSYIILVFVGRKLMSLWMGEAKIHELYTAACGLYVCWVVLRIGTVLYNWIPQGTSVILNKVKEWVFLVSHSSQLPRIKGVRESNRERERKQFKICLYVFIFYRSFQYVFVGI